MPQAGQICHAPLRLSSGVELDDPPHMTDDRAAVHIVTLEAMVRHIRDLSGPGKKRIAP